MINSRVVINEAIRTFSVHVIVSLLTALYSNIHFATNP